MLATEHLQAFLQHAIFATVFNKVLLRSVRQAGGQEQDHQVEKGHQKTASTSVPVVHEEGAGSSSSSTKNLLQNTNDEEAASAVSGLQLCCAMFTRFGGFEGFAVHLRPLLATKTTVTSAIALGLSLCRIPVQVDASSIMLTGPDAVKMKAEIDEQEDEILRQVVLRPDLLSTSSSSSPQRNRNYMSNGGRTTTRTNILRTASGRSLLLPSLSAEQQQSSRRNRAYIQLVFYTLYNLCRTSDLAIQALENGVSNLIEFCLLLREADQQECAGNGRRGVVDADQDKTSDMITSRTSSKDLMELRVWAVRLLWLLLTVTSGPEASQGSMMLGATYLSPLTDALLKREIDEGWICSEEEWSILLHCQQLLSSTK
ncbi:unnamed protein product [Amoebophrya sp. A25]|nr:unnamed protein product [Amoebophrya sp. A25]|eukprot:GSA25T00010675001.1